jgi:hypothetical protein
MEIKIKTLVFSNRDGRLDRFEAFGGPTSFFVVARTERDSEVFNLFWSRHMFLAQVTHGRFTDVIRKANELHRQDIAEMLSSIFEGDVTDFLESVGLGVKIEMGASA